MNNWVGQNPQKWGVKNGKFGKIFDFVQNGFGGVSDNFLKKKLFQKFRLLNIFPKNLENFSQTFNSAKMQSK